MSHTCMAKKSLSAFVNCLLQLQNVFPISNSTTHHHGLKKQGKKLSSTYIPMSLVLGGADLLVHSSVARNDTEDLDT
jgi:hypothetical protein